MKYGGKYWNIKKYLPYQRNFNFIDSERTIGKTYTTQGFLLERAMGKGEKFVYVVRNVDEIVKDKVFSKAFEKVLIKEFNDYDIQTTTDTMIWKKEDEEGNEIVETLGYCIALTQVNKKKKINLPDIKWMLFDEYILDEKGRSRYIDGWNEPELFIKLYHTLDRERDYITCFFLANSVSFYNPYHLYPAFNIPPTPKGKIWTSENVLYHWTEATEELKEDKKKSKFLNMIKDTEYGGYAISGEFINDSTNFVGSPSKRLRYLCTVYFDKNKYGIWNDMELQKVYISNRIETSCKLRYCVRPQDHEETTMLVKKTNSPCIKWIGDNFKNGNLIYADMEIKSKMEEFIKLIM